MQRIIILLILGLIFGGLTAQNNVGFKYQGVLRDGEGVKKNHPIEVLIYIRTEGGVDIYKEKHDAKTSEFGSFSVEVGGGDVDTSALFSSLSDINWLEGNYALKVTLVDDRGEHEFDESPILIPPYAAKTKGAESIMVGTAQIFGSSEGAALIEGTDWQVVSRLHYDPIEAIFRSFPIPDGYTREYWLGFREGNSISPDCSEDGPEFRFYHAWANRPGHQFKLNLDWGSALQGKTWWVQIPPFSSYPDQNFTPHWKLEARMPTSCSDRQAVVYGIWVMAVDKLDGQTPSVNLSTDQQAGRGTVHFLGGPERGGILVQPGGEIEIHNALEIDLQDYSGPGGRDALYIRASPDNQAGVILVNKPELAVWNMVTAEHANFLCNQLRASSAEIGGTTSTGILVVRGADIIERVHSDQKLQPGEVISLDLDRTNSVSRSQRAYDRTVLGVVSGAGGIRHGMELTQEGVLDGEVPVAIAGRVKVKITGNIVPGDLLTTSDKPGYAMKAKNRRKRDGAVIGKALGYPDAEGLVLMLVLAR